MGEMSVDELAVRIQQIIEWSRNLTPSERETLGVAVATLRRAERDAHPELFEAGAVSLGRR